MFAFWEINAYKYSKEVKMAEKTLYNIYGSLNIRTFSLLGTYDRFLNGMPNSEIADVFEAVGAT